MENVTYASPKASLQKPLPTFRSQAHIHSSAGNRQTKTRTIPLPKYSTIFNRSSMTENWEVKKQWGYWHNGKSFHSAKFTDNHTDGDKTKFQKHLQDGISPIVLLNHNLLQALNCTVLTGQRNATTKATSYFLRVNPRNQTEAEPTAGNEMEMQGVLLGSRSNDTLMARRNHVWTKTETQFGREHQGYSPSGTLDKIKTGNWSRTPSNFWSVTPENTKQPPCSCKRGMNEPCWLI